MTIVVYYTISVKIDKGLVICTAAQQVLFKQLK